METKIRLTGEGGRMFVTGNEWQGICFTIYMGQSVLLCWFPCCMCTPDTPIAVCDHFAWSREFIWLQQCFPSFYAPFWEPNALLRYVKPRGPIPILVLRHTEKKRGKCWHAYWRVEVPRKHYSLHGLMSECQQRAGQRLG